MEGLDGCGKSTQLTMLAAQLRGQGYAVLETREPGGTAAGLAIRELVMNASPGALSPLTELTLMFAARAQHIDEVILPALGRGELVLCDRYADSTVAYQGYGHGIALETIVTLERLLCRGVRPDLTLLLDIDAPTSIQRTGARNRQASQPHTRFEQEGLEFFERVRRGYREIARQEPERVRVLDATVSIDELQVAVRRAVKEFLKNPAASGRM